MANIEINNDINDTINNVYDIAIDDAVVCLLVNLSNISASS
jgi:hypothetical protein